MWVKLLIWKALCPIRDSNIHPAGSSHTVLLTVAANQPVVFVDRYSAGLHQAIEAKEGVEVKPDSHATASITFQVFFR